MPAGRTSPASAGNGRKKAKNKKSGAIWLRLLFIDLFVVQRNFAVFGFVFLDA